MASSSDSEVVNHPLQFNELPGPKGAYECRLVDGGLYVRVDMPGVPPDGLTLRKYSETRTVTFTGKAPAFWKKLDNSTDRVYGGYVILDQDPLELEVNAKVDKGCLRLFFPNAEGSLHSLGPKKPANSAINDELEDLALDADELEYRQWLLNDDSPDQETREMKRYYRQLDEEHPTPYKAPTPDQVRGVYGGNFAHINPFLLSGEEGFYEAKTVMGDSSGQNNCAIYTRVDMPGIGCHRYTVNHRNGPAYGGSEILFIAEGKKESRFDEGGRKYLYNGYQKCSCCRTIKLKEEVKDGVYRVLVQKLRVGKKSKSTSKAKLSR